MYRMISSIEQQQDCPFFVQESKVLVRACVCVYSKFLHSAPLSSHGMTHKSPSGTSPAGKQQHELTVIITCKPPSQMCCIQA